MTQTTELYFLTVLEASKTKVPANSVSSEGSSPDLQTTTFSLYFYMAEMEIQRETERQREQALVSPLTMTLTLSDQGSPLWPHLTSLPSYYKYRHNKVRALTYEFDEDMIQSTVIVKNLWAQYKIKDLPQQGVEKEKRWPTSSLTHHACISPFTPTPQLAGLSKWWYWGCHFLLPISLSFL